MDSIPIFSGVRDEDLDLWLTCGQFLSLIEDYKNELTEEQLKELCLSKLSNGALELFQKHLDQSWHELKNLLFQSFPVKLSIRDKVEIRKKLQQQEAESIDDFYQRCLQAQYLVSDDLKDAGFEREVLLHFLIGLSPLIRDLVLATKCSSTFEYIIEAKKYVQMIKEEPIEANIKIEADLMEEEFDFKNQLEDSYQDEEFDCNHEEYGDEIQETDHKLENVSPWVCDTCGKECSTKQNLKTHCQNVHKMCAKCDKTFVDKNKHYKLWHSKIKCKHCDYSCKDKNKLTIHMEENHNFTNSKQSGSGRCQICSEVFESKEVRLDHEEKAHGHLKQTCEKCNSICLTIRHLASHLAYKHCHKNSDGKFNCLYCNKAKISRPRLLGYHILNKHFNQPRFPCSQCEKGFDSKGKLQSHIRNKHSEERAFQCDKCAKAFKTLLGLTVHVENMHEEQTEAKCLECNKTFRNERSLKAHHHLYHKGERSRFMCQDCGKSFTQKETFRLHTLKMHSDPTEKAKHMVSCSYPGCDYSVLIKSHLKSHYKRVHLKEKNFQCSLCPKSFFGRKMFEEHTNGVHLNLKPYQCDKCEFATAYNATAKEHQKVAHGNQRYDCPHCNHSARYKGNLDKHINNVHKNIMSILTDKNIL